MTEATTPDPTSPTVEPLTAEGSALLRAGRPLEAVDVLRQAVASGEASAPDLLVRAYLDSGSWHSAAEWLGPLVEQGHVRFAGPLGVALVELGDRARAEDALRLAVAHGELAAANDLGILLRDGDRLGEAVQVLARAAEQGDAQAPANLVALHLEDGDADAAAEAAEFYYDTTRPDTVLALAEVRAAQAREADAEALYADAGRLGALRAHTAYGQFLLTARGDVAGAEREFTEARRHAEPGWAYTMGRFLIDVGRPDEARAFLQVAADSGDRMAADTLTEFDTDPADD